MGALEDAMGQQRGEERKRTEADKAHEEDNRAVRQAVGEFMSLMTSRGIPTKPYYREVHPEEKGFFSGPKGKSYDYVGECWLIREAALTDSAWERPVGVSTEGRMMSLDEITERQSYRKLNLKGHAKEEMQKNSVILEGSNYDWDASLAAGHVISTLARGARQLLGE